MKSLKSGAISTTSSQDIFNAPLIVFFVQFISENHSSDLIPG